MEYTSITPIYRNRRKCSNCGRTGHENKLCKDPMTSWGVINIEIEHDMSESLILKDKFAGKKKIYLKIISEKYPNIECYVSDNIKIQENEKSKFKLDDENIPYQHEDQIRKFHYYKDKILFMMVSRKYSLGFIEFIRGKYDCSDVKSIINLFEQMYTNEIKAIKKNQYDDILYQFLNRNNESKETVLNRIYEGKYCLAGRIANLYNLRGPNYTTDAACASAMAAITSAVHGLVANDFDVAVTGGIDRNMGAPSFVKFCKIGALSATGTRPYAEGANGFVMGEGAAVFLLKRLADAERDGDKIYAVLRGIAGSSDGKGKGITAPNPVGQKLAVERAWRNAGVSPTAGTLIEGHGTSTRVGDVVEVQAWPRFSSFHLPVVRWRFVRGS